MMYILLSCSGGFGISVTFWGSQNAPCQVADQVVRATQHQVEDELKSDISTNLEANSIKREVINYTHIQLSNGSFSGNNQRMA